MLVTEPARDGNKCVTERRGRPVRNSNHGRQAHSGLRHQDGRSAILEMARQIVDIEAMTDYEKGITLNVGEIQGGTGVNVVPGECVIGVDLRMPTPALAEEYVDKILNLKAYNPDVELEVTGGLNRPPTRRTRGSPHFTNMHAVSRRRSVSTCRTQQPAAAATEISPPLSAFPRWTVSAPPVPRRSHAGRDDLFLVDRTFDETLGPFVRNVEWPPVNDLDRGQSSAGCSVTDRPIPASCCRSPQTRRAAGRSKDQ